MFIACCHLLFVFMFVTAMKNTKHLLLLLSAILLYDLATAQTNGWCSTMEHTFRQLQSNPQFAQQYEGMKTFLYQANQSNAQRATDANAQTIYIPVVFHIVHNGDALGTGENISDAQIMSQLTAMNLHYTAQDANLVNVPAAFAPLIGNCNIQFCLAKFDPDGNPTTGIIRHQLSTATWNDETTIDNTLKPSTIWDHTKYMNIWSVRMGGTLISDGVLAYSSLPFFGAANSDGIVARFNTIGTTGSLLTGHNLGKTITHEAGHWLGLLHTWGTDANCGDAGDYVDDTPDQADLNFGCPAFPHISCNNGPNGDMFMNYMDYADDACSYMFSAGQSNNIHSVLSQFRPDILTASSSCFLNLDVAVLNISFPKDTICSFTFRPVVTIKNEGTTTLTSGKFYYQVDGDVVQIYNWNGSLPTQGEVQITLPVQLVFIEDVHTLDITFGNANGQASDNFSGNDSKSITFYAYNGVAGSAVPFTETFEATFPAANWSIYNPNNDVTWEKSNSYGGYGSSSGSVVIDNTAYGANPNKKKDALITDAYDFSSIAYPELKFDVAYAQYSASRADSLKVYYSLDCGSNWIKIWNQKGSALATAPDQTTLFTPTSTEWKTVTVPVVNLSLQNKVSFKFENVTGWGNAMYIDNINVQNNTSLTVNEIEKADVKIFPNPANNLVAVRLPANHPFEQIQLINSMGELVYETNITDNAIIIPVNQFANGLYLLHLKGEKSSQTEKLLISK